MPMVQSVRLTRLACQLALLQCLLTLMLIFPYYGHNAQVVQFSVIRHKFAENFLWTLWDGQRSLLGGNVGSSVLRREACRPTGPTDRMGQSLLTGLPAFNLNHQICWMCEEGGGRCGGSYLEHARLRPDRLGLAFTSNLLVVAPASPHMEHLLSVAVSVSMSYQSVSTSENIRLTNMQVK